ncbi:protein Lines homolog 1 [Cyprinodon tularosa]|uniref:protein Lines homolog 1 n=1 Tax=Cyprinodon tularosa TaxID=77115 RepID=UPI0018E264FD|nr:protein Lines homolog 1 [Cyprinodon tularosa]
MDVPDRTGLPSTKELFSCLTDCHQSLLTGSSPKLSDHEVGRLIFCGVCGQDPGGDTQEGAESSRWELTCLSLTLLKKICCSVSDRSLHADILSLLLGHMDLMPQLVRLFQEEDQVISHLAAQSASVCVLYLLETSGTVSPAWQEKCVRVFSSSHPGPELDACLWSLTNVLKKLLKKSHQALLGDVAAAFDGSLTAFCSKLLHEDRIEESWSGTTFCLLLDLLEALSASGLICGAGVCLTCQKIPISHSAALLMAVSRRSEYFVKKRTLLLLKRVLLQKPGEDWSLEGVLSAVGGRSSSDRRVLAQSVLKAVADGWLHSVQVEDAVFFGGARRGRENEGLKGDGTMLRAVSLILLKSVELHLQTGAEGTDSAAEVNSYLQSLWSFLRRWRAAQAEVTHPCSWISLLFGEQDDDLMEAASASLSIFLSCRRSSGLEDHATMEAACASGCNPHCHFLLLLQSLSFDHSILLDFLISSETCFLEYFVRYLKYLRGDCRGFTAACKALSDTHGSEARSRGLRLVEYDSSDESSEDTPERDKLSGSTAAEVKLQSESVSSAAAVLLDQDVCPTLDRAVSCLSDLREVVTKLQAKKLFPYNPSSLLKLLAAVENLHQSSPLSL